MAYHTAFFYGTLMAPAVLFRVCHGHTQPPAALTSRIKVRPAILHNYERRRVKFADYPGMIPTSNPSSSVRGTLVTGLTDGDIWRLDIFEGSQYTRKRIKVYVLEQAGDEKTGKGNIEGEEVEAETYIWTDPISELEDREWDFAEFQREKMRFWVGSQVAEGEGDEGFAGKPEERQSFLDVDEAVRQQNQGGRDPTGGRGVNGTISKALEDHGKKEEEVLESAV